MAGARVELSVIVPALNEAPTLPPLLNQLKEQEGVALEAIVVDAESEDDTADQARRTGARVLSAARGRGLQMNAGAASAHGDWLLFLHADSELTSPTLLRDALRALQDAIARHGRHVAGHFPLRFARRSLGHPLFYRYLEEKTRTNRPWTINGDQGLLISAGYFRELQGFDARLPFLEDQRLAERIAQTGRWLVLPGRLLTSARRFEREGHYRRYTLMSIIMGMHAAGVDEFFERAPRVYAVQADTGRLRMSGYLALLRQILREAGWRRAWQILYRAGRFTRQNSWQLFFWCDVVLRPVVGRRNPFLWLHDRLFRPLTDNPFFDGLAAVLIGAWFLAVLPVAYGVAERLRR